MVIQQTERVVSMRTVPTVRCEGPVCGRTWREDEASPYTLAERNGTVHDFCTPTCVKTWLNARAAETPEQQEPWRLW